MVRLVTPEALPSVLTATGFAPKLSEFIRFFTSAAPRDPVKGPTEFIPNVPGSVPWTTVHDTVTTLPATDAERENAEAS
jgi:hypothetical protein